MYFPFAIAQQKTTATIVANFNRLVTSLELLLILSSGKVIV